MLIFFKIPVRTFFEFRKKKDRWTNVCPAFFFDADLCYFHVNNLASKNKQFIIEFLILHHGNGEKGLQELGHLEHIKYGKYILSKSRD